MSTKDLSTCFFLRNSIYSPAQQTKIKGTGKRNTNIEILRILLMLMVCFLHLAVHGYGYFSHNTHPLNNVSDHSFLLSLLVSLTIPAVNTYVLISGYFGIKFKWNSVFSHFKPEGGNLAASKIRNLECPNYEICLIDYGCGKFNRKIHIMEQYP